jgi:hypothetical protein
MPSNQALQRTGGQQRFAARKPSQRLVVELLPPLSLGRYGAKKAWRIVQGERP